MSVYIINYLLYKFKNKYTQFQWPFSR